MTSLKNCLPPKGSSNWHRTNSFSDESSATTIRHAIIREVWLEKNPSPHAVYKIEIMSNSSHWFVFRRYKEFYSLHQKLVKKFGIPKDFLPPKKLMNNMAIATLEARREALEHYLQKLINSCDRGVGACSELLEFLDLKGHDVSLVVASLSTYATKNGERILSSNEVPSLTPVQLYCLTKQLQLPHPAINGEGVDLAVLYEFISLVKRLCISDNISKATKGKQFEINYSYDISMFSNLTDLQIESCRLSSIAGFHVLPQKLRSLTARYCLHTMKEILIDCAAEKRPAPTSKNSKDSWRTQSAYKLSNKRIIVQPWVCLTSLNMTHNYILGLDNSLALLPTIRELDLSYNKIAHLDLSLLEDSPLQTLLLVANEVYLISGSTKTLKNLKVLNLRQNRVQSVEGLLCAQGLTALDISFNSIVLLSEVRKLAALEHLEFLSVVGNPMAKQKRHRIMIFASFRDRKLELDGRNIGRKEKAKIDAKFSSDDDVDFDDNMSISTVSDDDMDSGIDGHVPSLEPLLEEDDFIAVDKDVNLGSLTIDETDESDKPIGSLEGSYWGNAQASPYGSPLNARTKSASVNKLAALRISSGSDLECFGSYQESLAANWKPGTEFRVDKRMDEGENGSQRQSVLHDELSKNVEQGKPPSVRKRTTEKITVAEGSSAMDSWSSKHRSRILPKNPSLTSFDKLVKNSKKKERRQKVSLWDSKSGIESQSAGRTLGGGACVATVPRKGDEGSMQFIESTAGSNEGVESQNAGRTLSGGACTATVPRKRDEGSMQFIESTTGSNEGIEILPEVNEYKATLHWYHCVGDGAEEELLYGEEECEAGLECNEMFDND